MLAPVYATLLPIIACWATGLEGYCMYLDQIAQGNVSHNEPHIIIYKRHMRQCKKNACAAWILQLIENVTDRQKTTSFPYVYDFFSGRDYGQALLILHEAGYIHLTGSGPSDDIFLCEDKVLEDRRIFLSQDPTLEPAPLLETLKDTTKRQEAKRVAYHLERARKLALPATLTLEQWLTTLNYFDWRCAYCPGSYEVFEHYTPLFHGGGTTSYNCVPACCRCNGRKMDLHPSVFENKFSNETIERIKQYFANALSSENVEEG